VRPIASRYGSRRTDDQTIDDLHMAHAFRRLSANEVRRLKQMKTVNAPLERLVAERDLEARDHEKSPRKTRADSIRFHAYPACPEIVGSLAGGEITSELANSAAQARNCSFRHGAQTCLELAERHLEGIQVSEYWNISAARFNRLTNAGRFVCRKIVDHDDILPFGQTLLAPLWPHCVAMEQCTGLAFRWRDAPAPRLGRSGQSREST
jgi:hypothetical protein